METVDRRSGHSVTVVNFSDGHGVGIPDVGKEPWRSLQWGPQGTPFISQSWTLAMKKRKRGKGKKQNTSFFLQCPCLMYITWSNAPEKSRGVTIPPTEVMGRVGPT